MNVQTDPLSSRDFVACKKWSAYDLKQAAE